MIVLQVCSYAADYPGNFIASMEAVENALLRDGIKTIYAFPALAAEKSWCKEIQKRTDVFFLPQAKARILPETYQAFREIYRQFDVGIVHSHFELYDIPATITAKKKTVVFWHLHDPIQIRANMRGLLWRFQYGVVGRRAQLLAVSDYYRKLVVSLGFPEKSSRVILNGIDLERIHFTTKKTILYDFLTFGWDFYRKGDDLILRACERLAAEGFPFKLLLNGNDLTWVDLGKFYPNGIPSWLVLGNPVKDVNQLFEASRFFIQASRRETFSYAVCEAAYAGLPVICSDIAGLEWAKELPLVSFFPSDSIEQLYALMKNHLQMKSVLPDAVDSTRKVIEASFSTFAWADTIKAAYAEFVPMASSESN